jgi:hypothetical protein
MINELNAMQTVDFPAMSVAVSEVRRLVSLSQQDRYRAE